ncbi:F-box domain-containing protein [Paramyrothecium foliicola]|nr:F-box domain-containing protein [Paramyrothecium foliicola]
MAADSAGMEFPGSPSSLPPSTSTSASASTSSSSSSTTSTFATHTTGSAPNRPHDHRETQNRLSEQLPFVPTLAVTSPNNYGRLDPENESNISIVNDVAGDTYSRRPKLFNMPSHDAIALPHDTSHSADSAPPSHFPVKSPWASSPSTHHLSNSEGRLRGFISPLLTLPPELILAIYSQLEPLDLAAVSATCQALRRYAFSDLIWQQFVQQHVHTPVSSTGPCASYRDLYVAHDRLWFLPKYKIWFSDRDLTGRIIIARFDQRRGCIEGYQLLAITRSTTFQQWSADNDVIIHTFNPVVKLHLDKPVLHFGIGDEHDLAGGPNQGIRPDGNRFAEEIPMRLGDHQNFVHSNFMLTRPLDPTTADEKFAKGFPYDYVWPPPCVPAHTNVSGLGGDLSALSPYDRPRRRSQVCDQAFRIRQWMELPGSPSLNFLSQTNGVAGLIRGLAAGEGGAVAGGGVGVHLGEEVSTYSTLHPTLYTPTPTKPWRGIWVGDYSGHGCEFLLVNQPDDEPVTDEELGLFRAASETNEQWESRRTEARMYRGRLEGIKLTGDPNVPRGEYTFVAEDLGPDGFVGVASDPPFTGARVVHSKGHIAATGFMSEKYIKSQLILVSSNRLAQYWVEFGHISYFERVNIDNFIVP